MRKIALTVGMLTILVLTYANYNMIQEQEQRINSIVANANYNFPILNKKLDISVLNSIGIITNGQGFGSCVAISPNLILTAGHCLCDDAWIEINGKKYEIIEQYATKYDIGFVRIKGRVQYLKLGKMPKLLDDIYVVGFPLTNIHKENCIINVTKGIVSSINISWHIWTNGIIVDAAAYPGNSGGPLLNQDGQIIGIMVGCHNRLNAGGDNFWLAEPVSHIQEVLDELGLYCQKQ